LVDWCGARDDVGMVAVVLGMVFCVGLAAAVLVVVAVPARRSGREVLTERGVEVVDSLRERGHAARRAPRRATGEDAGHEPAREKVGAARA
jgi:hypothetical protein